MRFRPLPRGAVRSVVIATALLLAWLGWGTFKHPDALLAPGDLSRFHADIASCGACHQPFRGTTAAKCVVCHAEKRFAARSRPLTSEFHQKWIREGKSCSGCHTEHRGALAQITVGAMSNPHGEFVFRATGAGACGACHDFSAEMESGGHLLDNPIVGRLMEEGEGAHRLGKMANCLRCHKGGRMEVEEGDEDE